MKAKGWVVTVFVLIVIALVALVLWRWNSQVYTDKKGEEAVKIISENPDAIFDPAAEKKAIEKQEKEEREKRK